MKSVNAAINSSISSILKPHSPYHQELSLLNPHSSYYACYYTKNFWTLWEKARVGCFERTACIFSIVKQITSPGGMHETSARAWCTGKTQKNWVEREVGGGIGMGNTCNSMADSCQCMTKPTAML